MTRRIFNSISVVTISSIAAVMILFIGMFYSYFSAEQMDRLKEETNMVAQGVTLMGIEYLEKVQTHGSRITWIDQNGTVLYDSHSDTSSMGNHTRRSEIMQAFVTGYGESKRFSDTLTEQYFYCARRIDDGTVVRLSVSQSTGLALIIDIMRPILILVAMASVLALKIATHLSKSIITPLNNLNLDSPLDNFSYEELSPLLRRIDSQQKEIRLQTYELQRKKDELDTIVGSMNDGLVLLKANRCVMSINKTARQILGIQYRAENKLFSKLCNNPEILDTAEKAWDGMQNIKTIDIEGRRYELNANPVFSENRIVGVALLFFDVTEKENAEQMRREFTANVSHELKSPLHSIAGYSELIMNGIATGEDVIGFSHRINSEAVRMNGIIQDIITLSQLDEGGSGMARQPVDLLVVAESVANDMKDIAHNACVTINTAGANAVITGILPLLQSTIHNLRDNAVKYNHPGGYVNITVKDGEKEAVVIVEDNGIGIPAEHQEKIFRRFYRVDKSRSREKGGSGLGLSIVKHAVKIHGGRIDLHSTPGKGTVISVYFPK